MRTSRLLPIVAILAGIWLALSAARDRPAPGRPVSMAAQPAPGKATLRVTDAQGVEVLETEDPAGPASVQLPGTHYRVVAHYSALPRTESVELVAAPPPQLATR